LKLGELIRHTERRLRAARLHYGHGTGNAHDEAAFLVLRGLGLPFDVDLDRDADPTRIERLVRRRITQRIPAAYLLKEAWLDGLAFYVDRRVIVPRSHIAELLAARLRPWHRGPVRRVLDLCTGSGCLAILAARAFPRARVDASDVSVAALAVARKNNEKHRSKLRLLKSNLFAGLPDERYDLIVTNPPYVTSGSMLRLPPEYRHEPGLALAAGKDGLDLVTQIVAQAPAHLTAGGLLVCEVGDGRKAVEHAYPRADFLWPQDEVFIAGRDALVCAARTAASPQGRPRRAPASR
jgi:ribosomal protein L3 glutamine methyltransferase